MEGEGSLDAIWEEISVACNVGKESTGFGVSTES